jgi:hypothetical protein
MAVFHGPHCLARYYDYVIKLVENAKAMAISEAWLSILPCRLMPAARSGSRRI